jgi:hypothetical protein
MKKVLTILIVSAMILSNASLAMAKGNGKAHGKSTAKTKTEVTVDTNATVEQENVAEEEVEVENAEAGEENNQEDVVDEENIAKDVDTDEQKSMTRQEIKNRIREIKSHVKDLKGQMNAVRKQFKEMRHNKEARQEILSEIAKIKREMKDNSIGVFIKGLNLETDVPPVIKGGRTLIPVRAVVNALGADVDWDPETRTVTITKEMTSSITDEEVMNEDTTAEAASEDGATKMVIQLQIDSNIAIVNGEEVTLDTAAEITDSRTIVPLRFIAETFGLKVDWDGESGTVIIEDETTADENNDTEANEMDQEDETAEDASENTIEEPSIDEDEDVAGNEENADANTTVIEEDENTTSESEEEIETTVDATTNTDTDNTQNEQTVSNEI